ncbi:MAG: hypothetical protein ACREWG_00610 [Gammaproteobacteria bacterium]
MTNVVSTLTDSGTGHRSGCYNWTISATSFSGIDLQAGGLGANLVPARIGFALAWSPLPGNRSTTEVLLDLGLPLAGGLARGIRTDSAYVGQLLAPASWLDPIFGDESTPPPQQTFTYTPSGGAQTGDAAAVSKTKDYAASGGAQTGGSAALSKTKAYPVSGGAQTGDAAAVSKTKDYAASGGAQTGGSAALAKTKDYVPAGGALSGGAAQTSYTPAGTTIFTYTASGGAQSGGAAQTSRASVTPIRIAGGSFVLPVRRPRPIAYVFASAGGVQVGGIAATAAVRRPPLLSLPRLRKPSRRRYVHVRDVPGGVSVRGMAQTELLEFRERMRREEIQAIEDGLLTFGQFWD